MVRVCGTNEREPRFVRELCEKVCERVVRVVQVGRGSLRCAGVMCRACVRAVRVYGGAWLVAVGILLPVFDAGETKWYEK